MEKKIRKIGVLTSGGDAPGMNAAIRAVVRSALYKGMEGVGIRHGYNGLLKGDMTNMELRDVSDIMQRGGTVLYTARCKEFMFAEGVEKAYKQSQEAGLDGLVVLGGDGSFRGACELSLKGLPCVGIPCTIDNDISCSDYTIGFTTALSTAVEAVDRLRDTSQSHSRCSIIEVMGHGSGHLALHSGLACGALAAVIPELDFDLDRDIISKMKCLIETGRKHFIIIVSEGVTDVHVMAKVIQLQTGIETRATVLGHTQRGGSPSPRDRIVSCQMGHYAIELLGKGIGSRVVVMKGDKIMDFDIKEALQMNKEINTEFLELINTINV